MEEKIITIYKITNTLTQKIYIGQTAVPDERLQQHFKNARECKSGKRIDYNGMYADINELGEHNFTFEPIDTCFFRHRFIIEEYTTSNYVNLGYNIYNVNKGSRHSDTTKQKMSLIHSENKASYQTEEFKNKISTITSGENNGMFGNVGDKALNGQTVFKKDKEGSIVETFVSVRHALESLGLKGHVKLIEACKNGTVYKSFYWSKTWSNR